MKTLSIGHSPDADDAFMFYGLASERVKIDGYTIDHVMEDIETLNRRARKGELDVTAISAAAYPDVAHLYRIVWCVGGTQVWADCAGARTDVRGRVGGPSRCRTWSADDGVHVVAPLRAGCVHAGDDGFRQHHGSGGERQDRRRRDHP